MEIWQIWLAIALALVIIEIISVGFAALCLAIGAVGAAVASCFTDSLVWQITVFAVFTLISFIYVRPFMLKFLSRKKDSPKSLSRKKDSPKSGVEALIGRTAIVEEDIVPETNSGRVAIDGDRWKAVSEDGNNIMKGEKVVVLKVDSIILTVRKA